VRNIAQASDLGLLASCGTSGEHRAVTGPVLDTLSVITLAEPDSVPITRSAATLHALDGSWYLSDNGSDRIVHFSATGAFLGTLGRHGQGPGEFETPVDLFQLGADTLGVADLTLRRITLFTGQRADTVIAVPSEPYSVVVDGDRGWIGGVNVANRTAVARWDRRSGAFTSLVPAPTAYTEGSPLAGIHSSAKVVAWSDSVLVAVSGYAWVRVASSDGTALDSFTVPTRLRRGAPLDLPERVSKMRDFPAMFAAASHLVTVADMGGGWLAFIYVDLDYDMQRGTQNPHPYLTLVNRAERRACVDIPVPASGDVIPQEAVAGDTLYVLDRRFGDAGGLATTITSYRIMPEQCPAEALIQF
jgi:hypothetical protein